MELKVLIAAISELKATRTTRTTKVKTAGEAAREGEVESLERIGSGLIGLLARVLATVVLGATLYTSRPPHSPTLIRQDLVRLRDFLELLLSLLLVLLLFITCSQTRYTGNVQSHGMRSLQCLFSQQF